MAHQGWHAHCYSDIEEWVDASHVVLSRKPSEKLDADHRYERPAIPDILLDVGIVVDRAEVVV